MTTGIPLLYERDFHVILIHKCGWNRLDQRCLRICMNPVSHDISRCHQCHPDVRPLCKKPVWGGWDNCTAVPSLLKTREHVYDGWRGNVAVASCSQHGHCPKGYALAMADYDARPWTVKENVEKYRQLSTLICFSPRGIHVYYYHKKNRNPWGPLARSEIQQTLGRPESVRGGYVLVPPSTVKGHSYWWLDDGTAEIIKL